MSLFTQTLDGEDWHLTYDTEAKELSIRNTSGNTRLSPNEFLSLHSGTRAGGLLELLIIDMFKGAS